MVIVYQTTNEQFETEDTKVTNPRQVKTFYEQHFGKQKETLLL